MSKYAIIVKEPGKEADYYPDPLYDNIPKALKKIEYLRSYRIKNEMMPCEYILKALNKQEIEQHNKEWVQWCSMID